MCFLSTNPKQCQSTEGNINSPLQTITEYITGTTLNGFAPQTVLHFQQTVLLLVMLKTTMKVSDIINEMFAAILTLVEMCLSELRTGSVHSST